MEIRAKAVHVIGFKKMYQEYKKSIQSPSVANAENVTDFADQPLELDIGDWKSDETDGVWRYTSFDHAG